MSGDATHAFAVASRERVPDPRSGAPAYGEDLTFHLPDCFGFLAFNLYTRFLDNFRPFRDFVPEEFVEFRR
jgi:hypothetical protein